MRQGTRATRQFGADYVCNATGTRYRYTVMFPLADQIQWRADVCLDDEFKGHLQGEIERNGMVEADIVGVIKAQVEEGIERLNRIAG